MEKSLIALQKREVLRLECLARLITIGSVKATCSLLASNACIQRGRFHAGNPDAEALSNPSGRLVYNSGIASPAGFSTVRISISRSLNMTGLDTRSKAQPKSWDVIFRSFESAVVLERLPC
ncbi:hypothetical protein [Noviherbaspirillum malthae]|uniref:hypothetical protein n=1 Tax=Noviherbaspirillum malthae TaxID=1260987 RepID=UPI0018904DB3|nr:hypothetical protein [Noviherbaspirillum malthae]